MKPSVSKTPKGGHPFPSTANVQWFHPKLKEGLFAELVVCPKRKDRSNFTVYLKLWGDQKEQFIAFPDDLDTDEIPEAHIGIMGLLAYSVYYKHPAGAIYAAVAEILNSKGRVRLYYDAASKIAEVKLTCGKFKTETSIKMNPELRELIDV